MSTVIESAISAFEAGTTNQSAQPLLSALRKCHQLLYTDLTATLAALPRAPDLLVLGQDMEQDDVLTNEVLQRWLWRWPNGVIWPITVATKPGDGSVVAPFRLLVMMPVGAVSPGLNVPRSVAHRLAGQYWGGRQQEAMGEGASLFLGMFADVQGQWEFGPAALWTLPGPGGLAVSRGLPLVDQFLQVMTEGSDDPTAIAKVAAHYTTEEIGMLINSDSLPAFDAQRASELHGRT